MTSECLLSGKVVIGGSNTGILCAVETLTMDGLIVMSVTAYVLKPIAESLGDMT